MLTSRPARYGRLDTNGAAPGDTLVFQDGAFRPAATANAPLVSTDAEVAFALPDGFDAAVWEFTAVAVNADDEVATVKGTITAYMTGEMTDADGEVALEAGVQPEWLEAPTVDGAGKNLVLTLNPTDASWRTELRLVGRH